MESDQENHPKEDSQYDQQQENQGDYNELRESMKQAQMELAKTKEQNASLQDKCKQIEDEVLNCREHIARQANLAQSQQKELEGIKSQVNEESKKEAGGVDYSKFRVSNYQRELLLKEAEISSLRQTLAVKDNNLCSITVSHDQYRTKSDAIQRETNTKSSEISNLKQQIEDLQKELDELYIKRKVEGTAILEVEHLKADNQRLIGILKGTKEYKDFACFVEDSGGAISLPLQQSTSKKTKGKTETSKDWIPAEVDE